jgi:acetyltransferase EpsM
MKPLVVIGAGGHSKVVIDIINVCGEYEIIAILDDRYSELITEGSTIFAPISYSRQIILERNPYFIIAIGNNIVRQKMTEELLRVSAKFVTLIHPSAVISPSASLGEGTVVLPNAVVNSDAVIGRHVIINTSSVIEHDNIIEDYVHISPGTILTGNVQVGNGTHIGAGSTIIPGKKLGNWSIIGAGSTIITDIPDYVTAVGTPAKIIKNLRPVK